MDMIDILGGILGQKSGGASNSGGGKILKDILGGNSPSRGRTPEVTTASRGDIASQAKELEDLLNVAGNRSQPRSGGFGNSGGLGGSATGNSGARSLPGGGPLGGTRQADSPPPLQPTERSSPFSTPRREPQPQQPNSGSKKLSANEEAALLVQAMLNAAKCDQEISEKEQQAIFQQIGNPTPEVLAYLRQEIQKPLDVKEFTWSVPVGMEQKVYAISLMAMDLKSQAEARYLEDLARGLRLTPEVRSEIHRHYGLTDL